ncbi:DNA cytosine methyltransferase [Telluribacter humicola]
MAIASHSANHPNAMHFVEDIRVLNLSSLVHLVQAIRKQYPHIRIVLWASLECTNFSKAKGGQPRDADSRTLAEHLYRYVEDLQPDYIQIENVVEFMSWGPLDENGKPVSRKNGRDWLHWREHICEYGYRDDWRELNAADFGGYTSRNRLFGIFAKSDLPIAWPKPTHAKNPQKDSLFGSLQKWKPVRDCLDFSDEGESIFGRKKPLVEKTLERIYAGLVKFVANGDDSFITKFFSGRPEGKNTSLNVPAGTITTAANQGLVSATFLVQSNGGLPSAKVTSEEQPARTITTTDNKAAVFLTKYNSTNPSSMKVSPGVDINDPAPTLGCQRLPSFVRAEFMYKYYGNGHNLQDSDVPAGTITTKDRICVVFLDQQYGNSKPASTDHPSGSITGTPKMNLVTCNQWLLRYQFDESGRSIEEPSPTILTSGKQNSLVTCEPWIMNYYSGSPECRNKSLDEPCNVVRTENCQYLVAPQWILQNQHENKGKSLEEPAPTLLTGTHHYLMSTQFNNIGRTLDEPCQVITANRKHHYLVQTETGEAAILIYPEDSPAMQRIKVFMAAYGIIDIKMRMLKIPELKLIQGFPSNYILKGTQTDQKKFIGNAVHSDVVEAWCRTLSQQLNSFVKKLVA